MNCSGMRVLGVAVNGIWDFHWPTLVIGFGIVCSFFNSAKMDVMNCALCLKLGTNAVNSSSSKESKTCSSTVVSSVIFFSTRLVSSFELTSEESYSG
ncbi:hypothetical protein OGAPHI_000859 [Ogataea philodendri]|uniref:Uncharacterized protein n=1 Tax=Ogataea philodendri TaxID=1378263 RepID=A0A9P8T9A7_9ASCO|nr:uncharacterized protein OGAPHI_000859 [Ogataea philodendri]KAH3671148.1 hypothetical protein OGAPHI_000859 [Ogataea philodendri]